MTPDPETCEFHPGTPMPDGECPECAAEFDRRRSTTMTPALRPDCPLDGTLLVLQGEFGPSWDRFRRFRCEKCGASYPEKHLTRKGAR